MIVALASPEFPNVILYVIVSQTFTVFFFVRPCQSTIYFWIHTFGEWSSSLSQISGSFGFGPFTHATFFSSLVGIFFAYVITLSSIYSPIFSVHSVFHVIVFVHVLVSKIFTPPSWTTLYPLYHKTSGILSVIVRSFTFQSTGLTTIFHSTVSHVFTISFGQINVFSIAYFPSFGSIKSSAQSSSG